MGLLRNENQKQNAEIASLKETVQSQNKTIHQHGIVIKELITSESKRMDDESVGNHRRNKRPVRLLPNHILYPGRKNETDHNNRNIFYGPPTNCSDLARLGYTLNGYYLVKSYITEIIDGNTTAINEAINDTSLVETIYCAFKQEGVFNLSLVEKIVSPPSNVNSANFAEVYFSAAAVKKSSTFRNGRGALTFDKIRTNVRNCFDGNNGLFTTPKNGIYVFVYTVNRGKDDTTVGFYLNDIIIENTISSIDEKKKAMIVQVTLQLNVRNTIQLKYLNTNDSFTPTKSNSNQKVDIILETVKGYLLKEVNII